jgi:hypothetical protein
MGFFSDLIYATLVSKEVRDARKVTELEKQTKLLKEQNRLLEEESRRQNKK